MRSLLFALALLATGCANLEKSLLAVSDAARSAPVPSPSPYAAWPNGPSTDPEYFPIGVWLQSPANAPAYQAIGVNLYVGLWQGPTEAQLAALKETGMRVICAQNEVGLRHLDDPIIAAWMHGDEPDNAQAQADGSWGPAVDPDVLAADYARWRERDPSRPVWLNLGQGVANDDWVGRAAPYEYYPRYAEATDIVSFDVYPVAGIRRDDGENFLWLVARGVERLRLWGKGRPVWSVIETTQINSERRATPDQIRAEVWLALTQGAGGIVYFSHQWQPRFIEAGLLADDTTREAVGRINAQIHRLAPALNAATVEDGVAARAADPDIQVNALAKRQGGDLYLFAVPRHPGETQVEFTVPIENGTVEVLDEDRTLSVQNGRFTDTFTTYQVHLYRITAQ